MAHSVHAAHTSTKATNVARALLLQKCQVTRILPRGLRRYLHLTIIPTLTIRDLDCHQQSVTQPIQNQRSHIQRYEKEADSLTTCTAAWHYQGHVVKDPWSNDYWQPLSFRSHLWSSQRLLPDSIMLFGCYMKSWLVWRRSTGCLPVCCRCQDTLGVHSVSAFITATDRQRVDAFLRRSKRCGFCPPDLPSFELLLEDADQQLFNRINSNIQYVLHRLPSTFSIASQHYELRRRAHSRELPNYQTHWL